MGSDNLSLPSIYNPGPRQFHEQRLGYLRDNPKNNNKSSDHSNKI